MNLQDILEFINFIINKEQTGKYISPKQYTNLLKKSNYEFFKSYFGVPEQYQPGMSLSSIGWELTDIIKDKLSRFMVSLDYTVPIPAPTGVISIPKPADYFFRDYFVSELGLGRFLKGYQFEKSLINPITGPTVKHPIGTLRGSNFNFAPVSMEQITIHYLRRPTDPYYDFYVDSDDNIIYLEPGETSPVDGTPSSKLSESVELDWDQDCIWDIIEFILKDVGVAVNRNDIAQYAQQNKSLGV